MREGDYKLISEYENKILYLQNKLKNVLNAVENVVVENFDEAKSYINNYTKSTEFLILNELIQKSEKDLSPKVHPQDKSYGFLKIIIENLGFPVFIKDENSRYLLINSMEAELLGVEEQEIIGKHDSYFIDDEQEMAAIQKSDDEVLFFNKTVELPNQSFSLPKGRSFVFKTHKIPFTNPLTGKQNILGFSVDITDTVNLDKLKKILIMNGPYL
ncbi:MAG TPA: PAS domain-containing protein [Cytophagaceae bacterium]|jgi:PAS domain S-box-containing protein|nr:PAS domain-containing protein [Cytophagaceae bacterium]